MAAAPPGGAAPLLPIVRKRRRSAGAEVVGEVKISALPTNDDERALLKELDGLITLLTTYIADRAAYGVPVESSFLNTIKQGLFQGFTMALNKSGPEKILAIYDAYEVPATLAPYFTSVFDVPTRKLIPAMLSISIMPQMVNIALGNNDIPMALELLKEQDLARPSLLIRAWLNPFRPDDGFVLLIRSPQMAQALGTMLGRLVTQPKTLLSLLDQYQKADGGSLDILRSILSFPGTAVPRWQGTVYDAIVERLLNGTDAMYPHKVDMIKIALLSPLLRPLRSRLAAIMVEILVLGIETALSEETVAAIYRFLMSNEIFSTWDGVLAYPNGLHGFLKKPYQLLQFFLHGLSVQYLVTLIQVARSGRVTVANAQRHLEALLDFTQLLTSQPFLFPDAGPRGARYTSVGLYNESSLFGLVPPAVLGQPFPNPDFIALVQQRKDQYTIYNRLAWLLREAAADKRVPLDLQMRLQALATKLLEQTKKASSKRRAVISEALAPAQLHQPAILDILSGYEYRRRRRSYATS